MSRGLKSLAIFAAFVVIYTLSRHVIHSTTTTTTNHHHDRARDHHDDLDHSTGERRLWGQNFSGLYNTGEGAAGTVYATVTLDQHRHDVLHAARLADPHVARQTRRGAQEHRSLTCPRSGSSFQFLAGAATNLTVKPTTHPRRSPCDERDNDLRSGVLRRTRGHRGL